jgi:hypothetical protein
MNLPREEKVAEGIYITKPMIKLEKKNSIKDNMSKYIFRSTAELINILESEFEHSLAEVKLLQDANEEMMQFDANDYDLIQAREDNLVIINKRIIRMKDIQEELRKLCPTNPIVIKDVFEFIKDLNEAEDGNKKISEEITSNTTQSEVDKLVTSIDL